MYHLQWWLLTVFNWTCPTEFSAVYIEPDSDLPDDDECGDEIADNVNTVQYDSMTASYLIRKVNVINWCFRLKKF